MRFYCQSCGESFVDHPANPFPRACWKCGGAWWSSRPPCTPVLQILTDASWKTVADVKSIELRGWENSLQIPTIRG